MNTKEVTAIGLNPWIVERLQSRHINTLTDIQVKAIKAGIADGQSMIVTAPTSSGKTLVGEIAVL